MSWADTAKAALARRETVQIRPRGHSMAPLIKDGDTVVLRWCPPEDLNVDDVVLVRIKGRDYLHRIVARRGRQFQIGNNRGGINGWVTAGSIHGRAILVRGKTPDEHGTEGQGSTNLCKRQGSVES